MNRIKGNPSNTFTKKLRLLEAKNEKKGSKKSLIRVSQSNKYILPNMHKEVTEKIEKDNESISLSQLIKNEKDDDCAINKKSHLFEFTKKFDYEKGKTVNFLFEENQKKPTRSIQSTKEFEFLYIQYLSNCALECLFSLISIASAIIEYELTVIPSEKYSVIYLHTHIYDEEIIDKYSLNSTLFLQAGKAAFAASVISLISTVLLWITIIFHLIFENRIQNYPKVSSIKDVLTNQDSIITLILYILFFVITPNPMSYGIEIEFTSIRYHSSYFIPVNSLFTLVCVMRVWFMLKFYLVYSRYYNPRAYRVAQMNSIDLTVGFSFKAYMKNNPLILDLILFLFGLFICSYDLRIVERYLDIVGENYFGNFLNDLWYIFITMTTVGYGDFTASTDLGRMVSIVGCFFGVFLLSLIVIAVTSYVNLEGTEEKVYKILERTEIMDEKNHKAEKFICELILLYHKSIKGQYITKNEKQKELIQRKLKMFQIAQNKLDSYFSGFSSYDNIIEHLDFIEEKITENKDEFDRMKLTITELENAIKRKYFGKFIDDTIIE